jgi:hypothetical protein
MASVLFISVANGLLHLSHMGTVLFGSQRKIRAKLVAAEAPLLVDPTEAVEAVEAVPVVVAVVETEVQAMEASAGVPVGEAAVEAAAEEA